MAKDDRTKTVREDTEHADTVLAPTRTEPLGSPNVPAGLEIDETRRHLAREQVDPLLRRCPRHLVHRFVRDTCDVRGCDDVVERQQRVIGRRRLLQEDIDAGSRDLACRECSCQGVLVMNAAPRRVEEEG